ncbi:MAG: hypothetical protein F6K22_36485 [Okeania sp. SIO2F4]|nr:hypothetical protein [Okeania sp. SIO2F4]NES07808.1 hypothetical protein [Okeania sp. SIO2F4]
MWDSQQNRKIDEEEVIGLWTKREIVSVIITLTRLEKYFSVSSEFNH